MDDANKPLMGINDVVNGWNEYTPDTIKLEGYRHIQVSAPFTNDSKDHYMLVSLVVNSSLVHVTEVPPQGSATLVGRLVVLDSDTINVSVFYKLSRRVPNDA